MEKNNVYHRLQKARIALQQQELKESGNNTFAKYTYMEIGDFIGKINNIFQLEGLCGYISYGAEMAQLTIVNVDAPEESIIFSAPMSKAELKGCHEVQNLGAVMTYLRRYLWITALEITEHDALDATTNKHGADKPAQELDSAITERLQKAANLDELSKVWMEIPATKRAAYADIKDTRKKELS